jgi:hypothetical protein
VGEYVAVVIVVSAGAVEDVVVVSDEDAVVVSDEDVVVVSVALSSVELEPVVGSTLASALALKMPTTARTATPRTALAVQSLFVRATTALPPL